MAGDSLLDGVAPELPEDLRAFVECQADVASIANGPVAWVEIPANMRGMVGGAVHPELKVTPGSGPATAVLVVKAGWISATLPAAVVAGKLSVDTSRLPFLAPGSIKRDIQRFVEELNGRLAANGKALGPPTFTPAGMTLTKVSLYQGQPTDPA